MATQNVQVTLTFDDSAIREARRQIRDGIQMAQNGIQALEAALNNMPVTATIPAPPP